MSSPSSPDCAHRYARRTQREAADDIRKGLHTSLHTAFGDGKDNKQLVREVEGQLRNWVKRPELAELFKLARELAPVVNALASIAVVPTTPWPLNHPSKGGIGPLAPPARNDTQAATKKGKAKTAQRATPAAAKEARRTRPTP